jgi:drug/metabolite transporter (DMT)-like permease
MTAAVFIQKGGGSRQRSTDRESTATQPPEAGAQVTETPAPKLRSLRNQTIVAAAAAALLLLASSDIFIRWRWETVALLIIIALIPTLAAYYLLWHLVEKTSPHHASSLFLASPPTTVLLSWIVLGTSISILQIAGTAAALAGLIIANRKRKPVT